MSPFTQFLGRLVELVGAENAAQLTRDFAGQALQFPITDHYKTTDRNDCGFPVLVQALGHDYRPRARTPLTEAEAMEISHRLLATVRMCRAKVQTEPLPVAETPAMDASCTTRPDQCTAPLHKPAVVQPDNEQEGHTPPALQPASLSVPQSILRS